MKLNKILKDGRVKGMIPRGQQNKLEENEKNSAEYDKRILTILETSVSQNELRVKKLSKK